MSAPIAATEDGCSLKREVDALRAAAGPVATQMSLEVYLTAAGPIPAVLREIGRLREIAFRAVGEGSGKERDLDRFDRHYLHLFLWDRERERIAGAYRLGKTDEILREHGPAGLYTSTLFELEKPFLDYLNPGLELGRSFVAPDYQKSIHPLALLWRGIGAFVAENPRYGRLFGPVSISRDYTRVSQDLIVRFLRRERRTPLGAWVRPFHPYDSLPEESGISDRLLSIEEVSAAVATLEPDGKGIPVLLRHYLRLNAMLLEFNIDPDFANALDALVLVDLREAPARILQRYLGARGLAAFLSPS